jgi:hypothetical protein
MYVMVFSVVRELGCESIRAVIGLLMIVFGDAKPGGYGKTQELGRRERKRMRGPSRKTEASCGGTRCSLRDEEASYLTYV